MKMILRAIFLTICMTDVLFALDATPRVEASRVARPQVQRQAGLRYHCPRESICDRALGIAITPAPGVRRLAPNKLPPHEIGLVIPHRVNGDLRLDIASWGTFHGANEGQAAIKGMERLLRGLPGRRFLTVRLAGAPGILARGLPGGPGKVNAIVLAHRGVLYKVLAPGPAIATDQWRMLRSLRFIRRVGPFPPAMPIAPVGARQPPRHSNA